jgi:hypothetical protein
MSAKIKSPHTIPYFLHLQEGEQISYHCWTIQLDYLRLAKRPLDFGKQASLLLGQVFSTGRLLFED